MLYKFNSNSRGTEGWVVYEWSSQRVKFGGVGREGTIKRQSHSLEDRGIYGLVFKISTEKVEGYRRDTISYPEVHDT